MVSKKQITKNIKDLEYNHILNKQTTLLVLIGTAIISVFLIDRLPIDTPKLDIILFLFFVAIMSILYFDNKLKELKEEIKNLNK